MIAEFFIDFGFAILRSFLALAPDITWSVDTTAWQYAKDFVDMIAYLLPMDTISAIVILIIDIAVLRVVISFIRTVLGLIPFI